MITAVGTVLLGNTKLGIILLISQLVSGLILGIISRFFYPEKSIKEKTSQRYYQPTKRFYKGVYRWLKRNNFVVSFGYIISDIYRNYRAKWGRTIYRKIFSSMGLSCSKIILPSILEVTGACNVIAEGTFPLYILSAVIAFGGFCVYLQIWGILSEIQPNKLLFVLSEFLPPYLMDFAHI